MAEKEKVTEMSVPETIPAGPPVPEAAKAAGAVAPADRCPVEHAPAGPASAEAAAPRPRATISATALPGPRLPVPLQILNYWKRPAAFTQRCRERYGSRFVLRISIPTRPLYMLTDPDDIKQMFLSPDDVLHTGNGSARLEKYFGQTGLSWLDEDEHKVRRKHIMQCVHGEALKRVDAAITEMAGQEIANWPQGKAMPLHPLIHHFTLNVIREVIFGQVRPACWEELLGLLKRMYKFADRFTSVIMIHKMSPRAVRLLTAIRPLGLGDFLECRERADALIAEAIEERRKVGEFGDDMLSELLGMTHDDGSPLAAHEFRDEIMMMFTAGTETTAGTLAWAFEFLSREHAARDRLVAEIDNNGGDAYLTATVQEILRLRPPVPNIILREVMKPVEIGGVRYEPGMLLWASAWLLHRNPVLYPDPYAFRPERFLGTKPGMYTWIPYGGGRIRCLGNVVAELEMKAVLREALSRYELRRADPRPEKLHTHLITYLPANGARLELRPRQTAPR
jgi:cytochrome P450